MPQAVQKLEPAPLPTPVDSGTSALMKIIDRAASDPNFDVAKLTQLLEVKERWEANEARKAFIEALNAFKANPPEIVKDKEIKHGEKHVAWYAGLDQVSSAIAKALTAHQLSHRWDTEQKEGGIIRVTCILTHERGHSERTTLQASPDNTGAKNAVQAIGSTVTYLQRYTLLAATGLATAEQDDDGSGATEFITPEQKDALIALIQETSTDTKKFLIHFDVPYVDHLPAAKFTEAKRLLEAKRKAAK